MPKRKMNGKRAGRSQSDKDFQTKKKKVGKVTTKANHTKVDFKSQSINIREQLSVDGPGDATNERGLGLRDLLIRAGHYNATIRRDALHGLRSLFIAHPTLLQLSTTLMRLVEKAAPRIADLDRSVRAATVALLRHVLAEVVPDCFAPFFPILMVHTCSAMTKMEPDVRLDALQFLDLWFEFVPTLVVKHSGRMMTNILQLISNPSDRSSASILRRLHIFIELLIKHADESNSVTSMKNNRAQIQRRAVPLRTQIMISTGSTDAAVALEPLQFKKLVQEDILPLLLECWMEHNPSGITLERRDSRSADLTNMKVVLDIIALVIKRIISIGDPDPILRDQLLQTIVKSFMVYFPMGDTLNLSGDPRANDQLQAMNLALAELLTFLLPDFDAPTSVTDGMQRINNYLIQHLKINSDTPHCGIRSSYASDQLLSTSIATCKKLANKTPELYGELLDAVFTYYNDKSKCHFESIQKRKIVEFFTEHFLSCEGQQQIIIPQAKEVMGKWIRTLPRLLWELRGRNVETSEKIILALRVAGAQAHVNNRRKTLDSMQQDLGLIFHIHVKQKNYERYGPFCSLPRSLQKNLIDAIFYIDDLRPELYTSIAYCCHLHNVDADVVSHTLKTLTFHYLANDGKEHNSERTSNYIKFLLSVAVGYRRDTLKVLADEAQNDILLGAAQILNGNSITIQHVDINATPDSIQELWNRRERIWGAVDECVMLLPWTSEMFFILHDVVKELRTTQLIDFQCAMMVLLGRNYSLRRAFLDWKAESISRLGSWVLLCSASVNGKHNEAWEIPMKYVLLLCAKTINGDVETLSKMLTVVDENMARCSTSGEADSMLNFVASLMEFDAYSHLGLSHTLWMQTEAELRLLYSTVIKRNICSSPCLQNFASQVAISTGIEHL